MIQFKNGKNRFCEKCGLPKLTCMCEVMPRLSTEIEFWILIHERELKRSTNTGKLIGNVLNNNTYMYIWERKSPPQELLHKMDSGEYDVYVVFPAETSEVKMRVKTFEKFKDKKTAFVLLDGTWQEARKMMRKSEFLKRLPILAFTPDKKSRFVLRKSISQDHLCTFETAIALLRLTGETENPFLMEVFFEDYIKHFKAGMCNHSLD